MNPRQIGWLVTGVVVLMLGGFSIGNLVENVGGDEIVVIQDPVDGEFHWYTTPGIKWQGLGRVTVYPRRFTYSITEGRIRFNDGAHGNITGSIQADMPLDPNNLTSMHQRYGGPAGLLEQVIKTSVDKSIYMTGPLMSSRESYAEKRTDLLNYVQDQVAFGVYKTRQRVVEEVDQFTGQKKSSIVAEVVLDANGIPARQEKSIVGEFGLTSKNFTIKELTYDPEVEEQIQQMQAITQNVQTSIANARKAEQDRITTEQQGQANAARVKWEQEAKNAQVVSEADGRRLAAEQDKLAAVEEKQAAILRAEGESAARRMVMSADGALDRKLQALERINQMWALSFEKGTRPLTPSIVMGSGGSGNAINASQELMNLLTIQTARQLGVDITPGAAK